MTDSERQEAIKIIKSECYISDLLDLDRTRMVNTALDTAIEALETPPSDDWDNYSKRLWKAAYKRGYEQAKAELENLERKKGKWISIFAQFECSECGAKCFDPGASKYCYKCGCPMEEVKYDDFDRSENEWR